MVTAIGDGLPKTPEEQNSFTAALDALVPASHDDPIALVTLVSPTTFHGV